MYFVLLLIDSTGKASYGHVQANVIDLVENLFDAG